MNKQQAKDVLTLWNRAVHLSKQHIATGTGITEAVYAGMDFTDKLESMFGNKEWETPATVATGSKPLLTGYLQG